MSSRLYQSALGTAATRTKPKTSMLRRFRKLVVRATCLQGVFLTGAAVNAWWCQDAAFRLQHHNAVGQGVTPVTASSSVADALVFWRWSIWSIGKRRPHGRVTTNQKNLTPSELECVQAVASLWSFDIHPRVIAKLAPLVEMYDPWFTLRGSFELRDAWYFASCLCADANPTVTRVARSSIPGHQNELFVDMTTDFALRFVGVKFTLPSTIKLTLDDVGKERRRITRIEHRWFKDGPIPGTMSYSDNFVARWADGVRHLNGFAMSVMVTTEKFMEGYTGPAANADTKVTVTTSAAA